MEFTYSVPITSSKNWESSIYRNPLCENSLMSGPPNMNSLQDVILQSESKFKDRNFLGTKQIDGTFQWQTYQEAFDQARAFGSALLGKNLISSVNEYKNYNLKFLGVYSKNRAEYIIADLAGILYDLTSVPVYDTLGAEALDYILEQTKMSTLLCTKENVQKLIKHGNFGHVKAIICFEKITEEAILGEFEKRKVTYYSFRELVEYGINHFQPPPTPTENSIYVISYTSGTTGNPKGAMMSHRNFLSLISVITYGIRIEKEDVYISILPMAHVFERLVIMALIYFGSSIGFFCGDPLKMKEDLISLRPTIMATVPRLLNRFYETIQKNISELTGCKKWLVNKAIATKMANLKSENTVTHCCYDKLVFKKMRAAFGGRLRLMIVGSAPTSVEVLDFLKIALCVPIQEGYGQTESTGASFSTKTHDHLASGSAGGPTVNTEFKIVDIPEMNYSSKDMDDNNLPAPRGEMCIRGPGVFPGYYKDEEKTKEAIDEDGWLHTGDVVLLRRNGSIKIIDRKKNIFKLSQGEYIAPEKLENAFSKSPCVNEIFVWGDSLQNFLVAIVVPKIDYLRKIAEERKIMGTDDELLQNKDIRLIVLEELKDCGKKNKFASFEIVKNLFLEKQAFASRDLLTTTFKMKRNEAKKLYEARIKEMYQEGMLV